MPQVSVLMTVRDEEKHVAAAVDSILGQSFGDFEFVVVDDGSADGTADALRAYDDARLRVTISSPVGRAAALNCALAQARAPLIALMDADDVSVEDRLARQVDFLRSAPSVGVCATWLDVIDAQGETIATLAFPTRDSDIRRRFLRGNPIGGPTAVVRRDVFDRVGGFRAEFVPSEDHDLWRRALRVAEFAVIPEVLYRYRRNPRGLSHQLHDRQARLSGRITAELRRESFPLYGARTVVEGARFYRAFGDPARDQLRHGYARDQVVASRILLRRGRPVAAARNLVGAWAIRMLSETV